jgi:division protein CdvB (Snf7/Vps24/ESCRT-III family)
MIVTTKNGISEVLTSLRVQENKLEDISQRFSDRGRQLFEKCVQAQQEKDAYKASMYAEEVVQLKKMNGVVMRSQLSLRQVALRIETLQDFKDAGVVLGPIVTVVNQIRGDLAGVVPEVANGLAHVDEVLDTLIVEAGSTGGAVLDTSVSSEEARKILQEASEISAMRMKGKFPELPAGSERSAEASESATQ